MTESTMWKNLILFLCLSAVHSQVRRGDEGACGEDQPRVITDSPVDIFSPNYDGIGSYPPNQDCTWLLEAADDGETNIEVSFSDFSLEDCVDCSLCDYVEAYDGPDANAMLLGRQCGFSSAQPFGSSGHQLFLRFVSDSSSNFRGFAATVTHKALPPPACLGLEPEIITDPEGVMQSPGYPDFYDNNLDCRWLIRAPNAAGYLVFFEAFDLENCCECDWLDLISGSTTTDPRVGRWWGDDQPYGVGTLGSDLLIYFRTDASVSATGFSLRWETLYAEE